MVRALGCWALVCCALVCGAAPAEAQVGTGDKELERRAWAASVNGCIAKVRLLRPDSQFNVSVPGPGRVSAVGRRDEVCRFRKCMTEAGYELNWRGAGQEDSGGCQANRTNED